MTRFGVMKHLKVLEDAGSSSAPSGGEAALPEPRPDPVITTGGSTSTGSARLGARDLKTEWRRQDDDHDAQHHERAPGVHPRDRRADLGAITKPEFTLKYFYGTRVESDLTVGSRFSSARATATSSSSTAKCSSPIRRSGCRDVAFLYEPELAARAEPGHVGDRAAGRRVLQVHRRPRRTGREAADSRRWLPYIVSGLKTLLETGKPLAG